MNNIAAKINTSIEKKLCSTKFAKEDYSLNGLQINFNNEVIKIAATVDIGLSTIEKAAQSNCQLIIAHHGLFWKKSNYIIDNLKQVLDLALKYRINIIAQHLPLDACPNHGNNFLIAKLLELKNLAPAAKLGLNTIGCSGENKNQLDFTNLTSLLEAKLNAESKENYKSLALNFGPKIPEKICIVSGSGCEQLYRYKEEEFDTLITGEPRQFIYHFCKDNKLNVICAGHYATETLGVKSLSSKIAQENNLEWVFIDEPTAI